MKDAILRAFANKASTPPAKAVAPAAAPASRSWAQRDYPHPAAPRVEAKVAARKSIHYRIVSRTGK